MAKAYVFDFHVMLSFHLSRGQTQPPSLVSRVGSVFSAFRVAHFGPCLMQATQFQYLPPPRAMSSNQ